MGSLFDQVQYVCENEPLAVFTLALITLAFLARRPKTQ